MYFIEKQGIHSHGIFWLGTDKAVGTEECNRLAENDIDDYHTWILYKFSTEVLDATRDSDHEAIYCTSKNEITNL